MEITGMPLRVRAGSVVDGGRFAWLMRGERRVGLGWAGLGMGPTCLLYSISVPVYYCYFSPTRGLLFQWNSLSDRVDNSNKLFFFT